MSSLYNRKVDYVVYWLSSGKEIDHAKIKLLENEGIKVSTFSVHKNLIQAIENLQPDLMVISYFKDSLKPLNSEVDLAIHLQSEVVSNSTSIIVLTESISGNDKVKFYKNGGDDLFVQPIIDLEVVIKIKKLFKIFNQANNANIQIEEASQMALLAMENSSDLGGTINFVNAATHCHSYETLAECIFNAVKIYSDFAILEMVGSDSMYYYSSTHNIDFELKKLLLKNKNDQTVVRNENMFQMNQVNLTLLVIGLPVDDVARMGRISDSLSILANIAERFASELLLHEQAAVSELNKRRFISTISHELNTPMNAIQGFSKLISKRGADDSLGKKGVLALDSIYKNSKKMNTIIETLIEITREEDSNNELSNSEINLNSLMETIRNKFITLSDQKNIKLILPDNLDYQFSSNLKHVTKMLSHLLDNAIKFTNAGEVKVSVCHIDDLQVGNAIQFSIKDTGSGISKSKINQLFKSLGQLDTSHDRSEYGIGLGLYYVQSFASQLNGKVEVNSEEGVGSEFVLTLPSNISQGLDNTELF